MCTGLCPHVGSDVLLQSYKCSKKAKSTQKYKIALWLEDIGNRNFFRERNRSWNARPATEEGQQEKAEVDPTRGTEDIKDMKEGTLRKGGG